MNTEKRGRLVCVGTGLRMAGQITPIAQSCIETADVVVAAASNVFQRKWLQGLAREYICLADHYDVVEEEGKNRRDTYRNMTATIMEQVRAGKNVCAAFYGHPGIFRLHRAHGNQGGACSRLRGPHGAGHLRRGLPGGRHRHRPRRLWHAIDGIDVGNGSFTMEYPELHELASSDNKLVRWLHDFVTVKAPEVHRRTFLKPFMRNSAEFCSACHKVHLDVPVKNYRWIRGFNDYDNWQASGVSGQGARSYLLPREIDGLRQLPYAGGAGEARPQ